MKRLVLTLLLYSTIVHGGGTIGGGNPPALEVDPANMMDLQAGAFADKLIRVKRPGSGYIYMAPLKDSIREFSMSARDLYSGEETMFQTSNISERLKLNLRRYTARTVGSTIPGILPILPDDFTMELRPTVEVVSPSILNESTTPQILESN